MTREQRSLLRKVGKEYLDSFLDKPQVKEVLRKVNTSARLSNKENLLNTYEDYLRQIESARSRIGKFPVLILSSDINLEKKGISLVSQFIYHIENYLAAVYVFDQRIRAFTNAFERHGNRQRCRQANVTAFKTASDSLLVNLRYLVQIRGRLTHVRFFDDAEMIEMEKYDKAGDFATSRSDKANFKTQAKILLEVQKIKWKKLIIKTNNQCDVEMGIFYKASDEIVWEAHRKMR